MKNKVFIPLSQGQVAEIDFKDYYKVTKYKWYAVKDGNTYYAYTNFNKTTLKMHRLIMDCPKGKVIDHLDHNGINNCRNNLKICSVLENSWNKSKININRGIRKRGIKDSWQVRIRVNGKEVNLGTYNSIEEARTAFSNKLLETRGK